MGQLRETIWAVSDKTIFFSELVNRLQQYVTQIQKMTDVQIESEIAPVTDFELSSMQTINFYRIMQEAMNNAMKYSDSEVVIFKIYTSAENIIMEVTDKGKGFDLSRAKYGSGINGMRHRAEEVNAKLELITASEQGTTARVLIPKS
jgi:signal transduction histidine kinase